MAISIIHGSVGIPPMQNSSHGIPPMGFLPPGFLPHRIPPMGFLPHGIPPKRDSSHEGFLPQDSSHTGFLPQDSSHTGFLPHRIPPIEFLSHRIPPTEYSVDKCIFLYFIGAFFLPLIFTILSFPIHFQFIVTLEVSRGTFVHFLSGEEGQLCKIFFPPLALFH